jgi:hypothetical protein
VILIGGLLAAMWIGWCISRIKVPPQEFVIVERFYFTDGHVEETVLSSFDLDDIPVVSECPVCDGLGCEFCPKVERHVV